ncbi:hypothetical protein GCM10009836_43720 [Pseudonocardia ailaonensis]|uniref:DUF4913 domain-containing protein n=1 Tax=Pseudonocardia ailaonensis TaxID=367279 RepID=A0ABN2N9L2_9PSEU
MTPDPSPLTGLAREVDGLRRAVDPLRELPGRVDELAQLVARLADSVAAPSRRAPAPSWLMAPTDQGDVRLLLDEVVSWLGAIYLRYPDAVQGMPECWPWHPDAVEELLWLMHAWAAAYQGDGASVALAADWHDRLRPGVVRRIRQSVGTCSRDNHRTRPGWTSLDGSAPVVASLDAFEAITDWWASRRSEPAPEPAQGEDFLSGEARYR